MRTIVIAVLLAGTASPALAAADGLFDRRDGARSERAERAVERAERQRGERRQRRAQSDISEEPVAAPVVRQQRIERSAQPTRAPIATERSNQPSPALIATERRARPGRTLIPSERQIEAPARVRAGPAIRDRVQREVPTSGDSVRDWRAAERQRAGSPASIQERNLRRAPGIDGSGDGLVQQSRPLPRVLDRNRPGVIGTRPAPGADAPEPSTARVAHARPSRHWRTDWRRDGRYDWRDYRRRHRSLFRLGFYVDPFGWGYHRYGIGWRLWPSHYGNRYWLNDPWSYRLPPAYGPYRWIRYWDDALLVNIYTGQVVDVVHNFFW